MNVNKLKGKIVEREMSVGQLAKTIGISRSGLYRRLQNPETISIGEMEKIKEALRLTTSEAIEIFFN